MRRAISAAVAGGLLLGGVAAMPAFAADRGQSAARHTAHAKARTTVTARKTVSYDGYELKVPANWPVYRLDENSATCVRYDIQAVYLGTPSSNMRCPAGLIGRGQTVSVIPSTTLATGLGSEVTYQREQPAAVGGTELGTLPAVNGVITQSATAHELRVVLAAARPATVVATYDASPALVDQVLASLRVAPRGAPVTPQSGSEQALSAPSAERSASAGSVSASWPGLPAHSPVQIVPEQALASHRVLLGFDTCTAPSLKTMSVWRQRYAAVGVYIGGVNYACAFGNLSAAWVRSAAAMGWSMLPTYVGPQAPCWGYQGVTINPRHAAAQGRSEGFYAVRDARLFGLAKGSPIYYDMEGYNATHYKQCVPAVLAFLGAWDREVAAAGYVTGVYSSQDSGIVDMQKAAIAKRPGFTPPKAVWFALWDNVFSLADGTLRWGLNRRNKQYAGNVNVTVGKIRLNIDRDLVDGPVAR
jgi:hypothetical protein